MRIDQIRTEANRLIEALSGPQDLGTVKDILGEFSRCYEKWEEHDREKKNKYTECCQMTECDFEENWVTFQVPESVMKRGFHAGTAVIDFTGVQA